MLRIGLAASLLVLVAACDRAEAPTAPAACNDVTINPSISVAPGAATEVAAAQPGAQAALLGGPIAPGLYDLTRVEQRGGAAPLSERLWETVRVRDSEQGQTLDFAVVRGEASNVPERYTARIEEGPPARLAHTCGSSGTVDLNWASPGGELHLLLPAAGGTGQTLYVFVRRTG